MDQTVRNLMQYLDMAHSSYHAVEGLKNMLEEEGYCPLSESRAWDLMAGGKYYVTRGGSSLVAFRVPVAEPVGFMMTASHCDRPALKVKENSTLTGRYTRLGVERYGGMLIAPWLDRPLSVAGRVLVQTENGVESKLVDVDRDLMLIPSVAIHMNRQANEGYTWDLKTDVLPLMGGADVQCKLDSLLYRMAGGTVLSHDLYLYVRENAKVWGLDEEYISAQALDDLACAWGCTVGLLQARDSEAINVLCVFDGEEVGSMTSQGAGSDLLPTVLTRVCAALDLDMQQLLAQSLMLSADNAHALHPNHPEYSDPNNAPVLGGGPVLKFNANMRYTTDGITAALMRQVAHAAGVPLQTYCNRADMPGGSTLGNVSLGQVSVLSADMGLPQLAMHSCYETCARQDVLDWVEFVCSFYSSNLEVPRDGVYSIR